MSIRSLIDDRYVLMPSDAERLVTFLQDHAEQTHRCSDVAEQPKRKRRRTVGLRSVLLHRLSSRSRQLARVRSSRDGCGDWTARPDGLLQIAAVIGQEVRARPVEQDNRSS